MSELFDFGFTAVDEQELEAVQKASATATETAQTAEQLQEKIDSLYNAVVPLLNNLKKNPEKRSHSYSLTYANKSVKETKKNLDLAVKLWGSDEEIAQINKEKQEQAEPCLFGTCIGTHTHTERKFPVSVWYAIGEKNSPLK